MQQFRRNSRIDGKNYIISLYGMVTLWSYSHHWATIHRYQNGNSHQVLPQLLKTNYKIPVLMYIICSCDKKNFAYSFFIKSIFGSKYHHSWGCRKCTIYKTKHAPTLCINCTVAANLKNFNYLPSNERQKEPVDKRELKQTQVIQIILHTLTF